MEEDVWWDSCDFQDETGDILWAGFFLVSVDMTSISYLVASVVVVVVAAFLSSVAAPGANDHLLRNCSK